MKKIVIALWFISMLVTCSKEDSNEKLLSDPLNELEWLKGLSESLTDCTCQISIFQGIYQSQTVYFVLMNDPLCDGAQNIILLDKNGESVKEYNYYEFNEYAEEVEITKTLFVCKED